MSDEVGRQPQYEAFADEFLEHARDGFANAHYDRPACLSLLGDVAGKRVLDAACGPGLYAAELVRRGAHVTGFDQSPRMVANALDPEAYEQLTREPRGFMAFRLVPRPGS
jgi:predicted TPR repeat methyltransferase